jgi:cytochrome c-type biogenesis protein CcmF
VRSGILDSIHAFGASTLGYPFVILIGLLIVGSVVLVVTRLDVLRSEHRLDSLLSREAIFLFNNLVLVSMAFVVLFLTFFPLIAEAITGEKRAIGPPLFNRFTVPLALMLVLLSGIGPVIAWRKATAVNVRRNFRWPVSVALVTLVALLAVGGVAHKPLALAMFVVGAFVVGTVTQEFARGVRARRAMAGGSVPTALVALVRRNRRRYGGYVVHLGMAVLFIGIAASSAFQHARDVRLVPGQTARIAGYDVHYEKATGRIATRAGRLERIDLGAVLKVSKDGKRTATLRPTRGYYPSAAPFAFGPVGRFFEGEATSEVGLDAGPLRDVWTAVQPDLSTIEPIIKQGDAVFKKSGAGLTTQQYATFLGLTLNRLVDRYVSHPPPATFRLIVSPLVTWLWLGALVVFLGGLIAMWPPPGGAPRRVTAAHTARVARELSRA